MAVARIERVGKDAATNVIRKAEPKPRLAERRRSDRGRKHSAIRRVVLRS